MEARGKRYKCIKLEIVSNRGKQKGAIGEIASLVQRGDGKRRIL